MAFSPEPLPTDEPFASDATVWQIADGAAGVTEAMEHMLYGIRELRQQREDALATAHAYSDVVDELREQVLSLTLRAEGAEADAAENVQIRTSQGFKIIRLEAELAEAKGVLNAHHGVPLKQNNKHKLNEFEASQIRLYAQRTNAKVKEIANRWGVHSSTISRILNGKAY